MSVSLEKPPWEQIQWNPSPTRPAANLKVDEAAFQTETPWEFTAPPELHAIKDNIASLSEDTWEYYKKLTNPYELIFTTTGKYATPPSICMLHPLSRSYFKMIEMMQVANIVERLVGRDRFKTAHVCEGPGGFIQAAFDEADRNRKKVSHAVAMTLRPTEHQIPGWKRAASFLKKHPEVKIVYGANNTGDILDPVNRKSYYDECNRSVYLFTADGGVDFATNYHEQERTIYPLLVASSLMALNCLTEGGICIMKIFDSYTRPTEDLILGLTTVFRQWTLYKPATSRPCNAEQYFIGVGFKSIYSKPITVALERVLVNPHLPHKLWPDDAFDEVTRAQYRAIQIARADRQIKFIKETLGLVGNLTVAQETDLWNRNIQFSKKFCTQFHLLTVPKLPTGIAIMSSGAPPA
jgi:23S rRNA U2552 (ribose-2'-O)-methylase RlmE/FtsJ